MTQTGGEIEYILTFVHGKSDYNEKAFSFLNLKISGERSETNVLKFINQNTNNINNNHLILHSVEDFDIKNYRFSLKDIGKVKSLLLSIEQNNECKNENDFYLIEIQLEIPYRNESFIFPVQKWINFKPPHQISLNLLPNLLPGQIGVQYAVTTHTDSKIASKPGIKIFIKIIGNLNKTEYIPLQHSQTNKNPFLSGKKDVFDLTAVDVGHIKRVVLRNEDDPSNCWNFDSLEIRQINSGHIYNFESLIKSLVGKEFIELTPINNLEVIYEVVLRTGEMENLRRHSMSTSHYHLPDVYFILYGSKDRTKKIYLNNFELKKKCNENSREKYFQFKWYDIGRINKINLSVNENGNPFDCLYIDYIEIKIISKSEAFKFPVERGLGEYIEDGRCDIDLEAWKHPELLTNIEYEVSLQFDIDQTYEELGTLYIRIHGNHGKTAKIKLIDEDFLDTKDTETYEFIAPDCQKINKIQLFYLPKAKKCAILLESIEIKIKSRNEAYRFPINSRLSYESRFIELEPWRRPSVFPKATI